MKPTIGRIVHFHDVDNEKGEENVYAAIITAVRDIGDAKWDDNDERQYVVDLVTFGSRSVYFQNEVEFSAYGVPRTWSWPMPLGVRR